MATKNAKAGKKPAPKTVKKAAAKAPTKPVKAPAAKKVAAPPQPEPTVMARPQTLNRSIPEQKAALKKGRVKSVATLKRAGLLRGKLAKKDRNSAPEKLVEAQLEKLALKWESLHAKSDAIPNETYSMKKTFQPQTGIKHKTLGWGFIIDNKNDRLEVLFKDGIRYLISNYK